ncbi:hypothetical protein QBC38DRAFT_498833 [Podospora fimiseda]|uniref:Uncharacterized protein n=1 Tax=Podospora fimiseda TaxID=252190 RepID=A0AAN7GVT9_9PEZI|nr:hypothetical protein QBC38DRAFT_498833 [Podospora fimiseda]
MAPTPPLPEKETQPSEINSRQDISRVSKFKSMSSNAKDGNDNRVKTDVLIAIKPIHLSNIEGGQGRAAITHIAVIPQGVRHEPGDVPTEPFNIGNDDFNAGLKVSKYGYPVLEVHKLVKPVTLDEMKSKWGMGAPMGWRYVGRELWEDRWGEDDERAERVRKVF